MKNIPKWFFATAAALALAGMIWGIQMSASHDHRLSPAHAHLNLVGFVVMSVYGAYYALTPAAARSRLARVHYGLATAAAAILVPGIVMAIMGQGETLAKVGSVLAVLGMGLFVFTILRHGVGHSVPTSRATSLPEIEPAE